MSKIEVACFFVGHGVSRKIAYMVLVSGYFCDSVFFAKSFFGLLYFAYQCQLKAGKI